MNTEREKTRNEEQVDETFLPLSLVHRIITLLQWVVVIPILAWVILTAVTYIAIMFPSAIPSEQSARALALVDRLSPFTSDFAKSLWSFLAPILSIVVIVVLIRWLLFSQRTETLGKLLGGLVRDVPSLIAVVVILTVCLLPLLRFELPDALSNIALVIVGFYFGTERKLKFSPGAEVEQKAQPPSQDAN